MNLTAPRKAFSTAFGLSLFLLVLTGCPKVQLVADYDQGTMDAILQAGRRIDVFYGVLEDTPDTARHYTSFADEYVQIEADLQALVRRNRARPLNEESTRISEITLGFWQQYRTNHRTHDRYPAPRFDHRRFDRLLTAALQAETAKKLGAADTTVVAGNP